MPVYLIFTFREFKSIHKGKTAILHLCFGTEKNRRLGSKKARYNRAFRRRHLFCLHIMVRVVRLERTVSWSQTYVWTFSEGSCALFGTFRHSCGSSLELYWTVYFSHRFRLLGFVWDWILYIKSASDRVYLQQRVLFAAERSSETAPHQQRNKRWRDITHPLDKRKMCCGR